LYDLGMTLLHSGTTFDRPGDLTEAVEVLKAAKRRPDSSVHPAAVLSALGNARLARIKRVKRQDKKKELDAALEAHRLAADAAETAEPGDPVIQACMADAAAALTRAYEETGDHRLLAASVDALRGAADATPDEHFRKAERLSNLAFALIALHEVTVNAETLDEAISTARAAVAAADAGHAHRLSCLYALAYGLFRRAELRQMLIDADEAAMIADEVAHRTDQADTRWAMRQAFRAQAMCYLPTAVKLRRADEDLAAAAGRLRHDDPDRALIVSNRGALMEALVGFLDSTTEEARQRAEQAVQLTKEAADATPPDHSEYPVRLLNFVLASTTLARLQRDLDVLDIHRTFRVPAPPRRRPPPANRHVRTTNRHRQHGIRLHPQAPDAGTPSHRGRR
jgi:tetratricopeptide (TPR) repeat protein